MSPFARRRPQPRARTARRMGLRAIRLCGLALAGVLQGPALMAAPLEYQVKAAFLYNFAKFVDWPSGSLAADDAGPLQLCLLEDDPSAGIIEAAVSGKRVKGHTLQVRRIADPARVAGCQLLFASRSTGQDLPPPGTGAGAAVLSVGEADGGACPAVMICFRLEQNKVRFDIDLAAARRAGLKISSKLLNVARTVHQ